MHSKSYDTNLTDAQWERIAPYLQPRGAGRRPKDLRRMFDAVLYLGRTGCQWRMLPKEFGPWETVRYHFDRWTVTGRLDQIHTALRGQVRMQAGRHPEPGAGIVDSQSVKTTEAGGDRGYDAGKR